MKVLWGVLFIAVLGARAEARVFNINSEKFASYFLVTGATSQIKQNAFANEVNTTTTYSGGEVALNYTGEFGFLYSTPNVSVRFGFELYKPSALKQVVANDGSNDTYSLASDITGYAPKIGIELNLQKTNVYRSFIHAYIGSGSVTLKNDYTILNFAGVSDHSIDAKGSGSLYGGAIGVESHMTDTTTYIFEMGYRQLKFANMKYSKDVSTFSGGKNTGDPLTDTAGTARVLDFTGPYISLGFRFYM